jgi:hypothetical protein
MIKIYSARDITEAHIVKGLIEAHGIDAYVGGLYLQGGVGELATMDFASIHVDEADATRARQLIDAYEKGEFATED